ncbi:hypothetical protein MKX03_002124 [Papaver bracteatum]|nr:hypothetical protein MKX03_002124 [Papaver bracteatum]
MATRFRGFARMLSTAKNSTKKEGLCRICSSAVEESPKERMMNTSGDIDYQDIARRANKEFYINVGKGASVGVTLGIIYNYFVIGWYPFKDTIEGGKYHRNHALQPETVHAMKFKR